ncbi:MAG: acetyl-CoA carboxylase biotin carboxyl carrier protein [Phycisphaeraceae bacterium]|nr:acetyl-CoA carboxylase biotin carboxyl carrier protein [Phycisphaeraceae bacterium]
MVDLKKLRELVKLMVDNDIAEVDLKDDAEQIKLKRGAQNQPVLVAPQAAVAPVAAAPVAAQAPAPTDAVVDDGLVDITSPTVGTFYSSSSPDAKAFISAGSKVSDDTVVCIIEAMKVFNEIKAEVRGTVEQVLVENGQAVEFGQPLFKVKPN